MPDLSHINHILNIFLAQERLYWRVRGYDVPSEKKWWWRLKVGDAP